MSSKRKIKLQSIINDILVNQIGSQDSQLLFDVILKSFIEYTESQFGFIGKVLHKPDGKPYLKTYSMTNIAWNDEVKKLYESSSEAGFEFYNLKTLYGWVIEYEMPLITNDPTSDERSSGLPNGHPVLDSFLGIPLLFNNKLIGMVGLANGVRGFHENLITELEPLIELSAGLIANEKLRAREKELTDKLTQQSKALNAAAIVAITDVHGVIKSVNKKFCEISGFDESELLGQTHRIINSKYHSKEFFKNMWETMLSGQIWRGEVCNRNKNGNLY